MLLSILIPAYNFPKGVSRILSQIFPLDTQRFEVLVLDDSTSNHVYDVCISYLNNGLMLKYRRNTPSLGAVNNWNKLLSIARGKYCLIMHHDDFPIQKDFISLIEKTLDSSTTYDVFVMNHAVINRNLNLVYGNISNTIRSFFSSKFPEYIIRRNYLGSMSTLVVKRSAYPLYCVDLCYLVDCELFHRLMTSNLNFCYLNNLTILTVIGEHQSITQSLAPNISEIIKRERCLIFNDHKFKEIWFNNKVLIYFEKLLWIFVFLIPKIFMMIGFKFGIWPFNSSIRNRLVKYYDRSEF